MSDMNGTNLHLAGFRTYSEPMPIRGPPFAITDIGARSQPHRRRICGRRRRVCYAPCGARGLSRRRMALVFSLQLRVVLGVYATVSKALW